MRSCTETCGHWISRQWKRWTSSLEDFRVSRTVPSTRTHDGPRMKPKISYGRTSPTPFAWLNRRTLSWRTFPTSYETGLSPSSSRTWPRAGTMRNGILYRRTTLGRFIGENARGLLPTPVASEWNDRARASTLARQKRGGRIARVLCMNSRKLRSYHETVYLNPFFAEWLMGFPRRWIRSKRSGTRSSRK